MTIETITEHGDPSPDPERDASILPAQADADAAATTATDAALQAQATATIKQLLVEHPAVAKEIKDTLRIRVYLRELAGRTNQAEVIEADTEQHEANLAVKLDPGDHRVLGFGLGLAIVVALVILDAVPLNWAAQAFGLNSAGTWLVTFILVVASIGAMLGFEITRGDPRRRGVLTAVVAMVYLALLGLRTEFLITVSSDSLPVAVLQSTLLTAISAGLSCAARRSWPGPGTSATHGLAPPPGARPRPLTTPAPRNDRPPRSSSGTSAACTTCSSRGRFARPLRSVSTTLSGTPRSTKPSALCSRPRRDRAGFAAPCTQ